MDLLTGACLRFLRLPRALAIRAVLGGLAWVVSVLLAVGHGWAGGDAPDRLKHARALATAAGYHEFLHPTTVFTIREWSRPGVLNAPVVRVYIEGDGFAWVDRNRPSVDPTPKDPLGLRLAAADPYPHTAYLARPCQYVMTEGVSDACGEAVWTAERFSSEVISSLGEAIDQIKRRAGATGIELVGYSGGATVALLLAGQRADDPDHVNRSHGVSALRHFEGLAAYRPALARIPQLHFIGARDRVIPADTIHQYTELIEPAHRSDWCVIEEADHRRGWVERWPELLEIPLPADFVV
jgi:hypothetical protein